MFEAGVFFIALGSGAMGAILGLGGGIFLVPLLTLLLGLPMKTAVATSLVAVVATSLSASSSYIRKGLTNIRLGLFLETATTAGAVAGGFLAAFLNEKVLAVVFSLVAFYTAGSMLLGNRGETAVSETCGNEKADPLDLAARFTDESTGTVVSYQPQKLFAGSLAGIAAGALSGLLGIGGGPVKVPIMKIFMGLPLKAAAATSNFMVGITATAGAFVYLFHGFVREDLAALTVFGIFAGARLGVAVACKIHSRYLNLLFVAVLTVIAVRMLLRGLGAGG
ncbi:MAG: sulfite exporter TauE/SafE family protein [Thermovirgaceae bacterium]